MKKVLLMYPPGPLFQRGEDRCQQNIDDGSAQSMRASNDLGYAAAVLLKKDYDVKLRDYQTELCTEDDLFRELKEYKPDMVMISVTNTTIFDDIKIAARIKDATGAIIVLKGAIFYAPEQAMLDLLDFTKADYLIGGEVDFSIDKIADYAFKGIGNIAEINNILYKDENGNMVPTKFHVWDQDLDAQPFPARGLMNNKLYCRPDTDEPMATIQTSRGCPSNCIFCLSPEISGKKVRFRSPQSVMDELTDCFENHGIRNFFFKADTFTINAEWVKELCELIMASPLHGKIEFTANSRVKPLKEETLILMKKAGCFAVAFGFESGSEDTLKKVHKGATVAQNIQACKWAKDAGLLVWGFFVIGFPWETKEHIKATKKLMFTMKPDFVEITLALPFYGTPLYDMAKEQNLLAQSVLGSDFFHSSLKGTAHLSTAELMKLRRNILLQYYLRPTYILKKMGECVKQPKVFLNYVKYGIKLIVNLAKLDKATA